MDQVELPAAFVAAGREYLAGVRALGLDPEGLFWGRWEGDDADAWHLHLVTSLHDRIGPLRVTRLLVQAYNASRLPREVSPFIVELHSPAQSVISDLFEVAGRMSNGLTPFGADGPKRHPNASRIDLAIGPLRVAMSGIYVLEPRRSSPVEAQRQWKRFKRNVEALAA